VVTDPQTNTQTQPQTHKHTNRLQYTAPLSLARSVIGGLDVCVNLLIRDHAQTVTDYF